jgi:hypothetical protein
MSKCSKPKGAPCRIHNPVVSATQVSQAQNKIHSLFVSPSDAIPKPEIHSVDVTSLVPRASDPKIAAYYEATDKKHFGNSNQPGSKFTDSSLTKVEDVIQLAKKQRGSLRGDDRAELIKKGADVKGFLDSKRYLMVSTPGKVGIMSSTDLKDSDELEVVRTKPGVPCSLVRKVNKQPVTDYAVIVLAKNEETGKDLLITTFPGPVTKPLSNIMIDELEGKTITVLDAKKILGTKPFWVNTKI